MIRDDRDQYSNLADLYILDRMAECYPLLIKMYKYKGENEEDFKRCLRLMEILLFRSKGIIGLKVEMGNSRFNPWAYEFAGDFKEVIKNMKDLAVWWDQDKRFIQSLNSSHFYSYRKIARYLLWKYENELSSEDGFKRIEWRSYLHPRNNREKLSIEHITAQAVDELEYSLATLKGDSVRFREKYLHCVGNLVLDCHAPNASKGKKPFPDKINSFKSAPLRSQNELSEKDRDGDYIFIVNIDNHGELVWDKQAIRKRKKKIIHFAIDYWDPRKV